MVEIQEIRDLVHFLGQKIVLLSTYGLYFHPLLLYTSHLFQKMQPGFHLATKLDKSPWQARFFPGIQIKQIYVITWRSVRINNFPKNNLLSYLIIGKTIGSGHVLLDS